MDKKRIMLVDDEVSITRLLQLNLEATGNYEVLALNQGSKVVEAARTFDPDLIFLDVMMPDLDGPSVAEELKADPLLALIPIIFMTAVVSKEEAENQSGIIGGHTFLAKPVDVDAVKEHIETYSRQR